jgi:small subunit ribosomal protein S13
VPVAAAPTPLPPPRAPPASQASAPRRTPLRVQNLRVNNVEIPNGKRIEISLQYIYGIGSTTAQTILRETVRRLAGWGQGA